MCYNFRMLLQNLLTRNGEKFLKPFRNQEEVLKMPEFSDYKFLLPVIEKHYKETEYWHGTGRYQYKRNENSRYDNLDTGSHIDILESILNHGGLRPHNEPWLEKMQQVFAPTISLTPFRMYAMLYAGLYFFEEDSLLYRFGTTKFWFRLFLTIQVLDIQFLKFFLVHGIFKLARPSTYKNAQLWIKSIRQSKKDANPLKGYLIKSDIKGNYPILIAIKKNSITPLGTELAIRRLETRTTSIISLEQLSHIEVPLKNIEETRGLLKRRKVDTPIIPLEFIEYYLSHRTLKQFI